MGIKNFVSFKKNCEIIVVEQDLTNVLTVLNDSDCGKVVVEIHRKAEILGDDTSWRVSFKATPEHWMYIYPEVLNASKHKILVPLKDVFGYTILKEV